MNGGIRPDLATCTLPCLCQGPCPSRRARPRSKAGRHIRVMKTELTRREMMWLPEAQRSRRSGFRLFLQLSPLPLCVLWTTLSVNRWHFQQDQEIRKGSVVLGPGFPLELRNAEVGRVAADRKLGLALQGSAHLLRETWRSFPYKEAGSRSGHSCLPPYSHCWAYPGRPQFIWDKHLGGE